MTADEARRRDDGRDDPSNPVIPFRMSDRLQIYGLGIKINTVLYTVLLIAGLVGAGMALKFL